MPWSPALMRGMMPCASVMVMPSRFIPVSM
jgi:hypothetical protein